MELQEFIKKALADIVWAVAAAQDECKENGSIINPTFLQKEVGMRTEVQHVEFDIALSSSEETSKRAGIGVFLGSVGLGGRTHSEAANASLTRIKFSVPIRFRGD